jgi:hypothetical protein
LALFIFITLKTTQMKKIVTIIAIAFLSINVSAQEVKAAAKDKTKKESCCSKKETKSKKMTAEEVAKCQAKCKADGKKCDTGAGKKC